MLTKEFNVFAEVASPKIYVSTNLLEFGYITIEQPLEKKFYIENLCNDEVRWELHEFTYDFQRRSLIEIGNKNVSIWSGILKGQGKFTEISYRVNAEVKTFVRGQQLLTDFIKNSGVNLVKVTEYFAKSRNL